MPTSLGAYISSLPSPQNSCNTDSSQHSTMASSTLRLLSRAFRPPFTHQTRVLNPNFSRFFWSRPKRTFYLTDSEELDDPNSPIKTTTIHINSPHFTNIVLKQPLPLPYYGVSIIASWPTIVAEPGDPEDIAQVYKKVNTLEGVIKFSLRMMDHLMTEGYFQEAKEFMAHVKNGNVPVILILTGMMEEYADAGRTKDALIVYRMMENNKCAANRPNAYSYSVIIEALVKDKDPDFLGVAKECVMKMMGRGMQPNAGTYAVVFEGFVEKEKAEEGRELVEEMKAKGFVADKKAVREVVKGRRGVLVDKVIKMVFAGVFGKRWMKALILLKSNAS
ncbi:hypothetical protein ABKV19_021796 [Rosa sericea]